MREPAATWTSFGEAAVMFLRGATVPAASRIALVVGTWLSLLNHGGPIAAGDIPWLKVALDYATPFTVASLGFLAARRRINIEYLARTLEHEKSRPEENRTFGPPPT